jgi:hypothetical protein
LRIITNAGGWWPGRSTNPCLVGFINRGWRSRDRLSNTRLQDPVQLHWQTTSTEGVVDQRGDFRCGGRIRLQFSLQGRFEAGKIQPTR